MVFFFLILRYNIAFYLSLLLHLKKVDLFPRAWCGCLNHEGETGQSRFYDGGGGGGGGGGGEDGGTSATWNRRQRENGGGRKKFDERRFVLCRLGMDDRKVL